MPYADCMFVVTHRYKDNKVESHLFELKSEKAMRERERERERVTDRETDREGALIEKNRR